MLPRTKFPLLALIAALSLTAAGCGLKGPLYRPDEARPASVTPTAAQTSEETSRKKDSTPRSTQPNEQNEPPVSPPDPDRGAVPPPDR
jgi:predicted small lipoprotein YifL